MKKEWKKTLIILFCVMWVISVSTIAAAENESIGQAPELAPLYGDHDLTSVKTTTVIVELEAEPIVAAKHQGVAQSKASLASERNGVIEQLQRVTDVVVHREYDYLFSGFSVSLPANQIPQLLALPGVKAVYPDVQYTVMEEWDVISPEAYSPQMHNSAPFIGAPELWELGYTGQGVTVAIIDTGVDYTHPDLTHAFGEYKGWDFVDQDDDPQETQPGDPRGEPTTHGTHVAGTVAANGLIKGVAPDAHLLAYRVLGPQGGTTTDVVAAIERAVQDGAHVMNLSLGNSLNNPDWATSIALDRAMAEGVVAVTSNGNAGPENWTVGAPATSRKAISVGATRLPYNVYAAEIDTDGDVTYPTAKVMGFPDDAALLALDGNAFEYVDVGLGYPEDFEGKDVEGKIALISRGDLPFVDKAENAKHAGAIGAIIYNNVAGEIPYEIAGMAVPTIKLDDMDGQKMLAELENGNNTVRFEITFQREVGETVADFSSRGPVVDTWMIKPDVLAPGVNIVSTIPTHDPENPHGYASSQGTSMASPHVAGAAALLLQANPQWGAEEVKAALMNTAEKLTDADGDVYPHNSQGAGSIRPLKAVQTESLILPGSYSFGVFDREQGAEIEQQSFEITNLTNETKRYEVEAEFFGHPLGIKVTPTRYVTVGPNSTETVQLHVNVQAPWMETGYYEGVLRLTDDTETYEIPTILFVREPDYPRITHFYVDEVENGYDFTVYLPRGAEEVGVWIYTVDSFSYVGEALLTYDVGEGETIFSWDGTVNGEPLPPGSYYLFAYAVKLGQLDYVQAEDPITIEDENDGQEDDDLEGDEQEDESDLEAA